MRCAKCGGEVKPTDACCPHCSHSGAETQNIRDIKLADDPTDQGSGYREYRSTGPGGSIHVKQINLFRMGFWSKLLGLGILIVLFVLVLPLALLLSLVFAAGWLFMQRRK